MVYKAKFFLHHKWPAENTLGRQALSWEDLRLLLGYNPSPHFSLILFSLEGEEVWDKKGNKVLDREVNHKLSRGTQF